MFAALILSLARAAQEAPPAKDPGVVVWPGAVEAPRQPLGGSDAAVLRSPRPTLALAEGSSGTLTVRIGDMAVVRGQEENQVQGIGLVTGLSGTGDSTIAARQAILNLLKTQNIVLDLQSVSSANAAVVLVQAVLEPGIKPGRQIDVRVSSLYDCESLVGGTLLAAELVDMTGSYVYVTAAGPVTTGAFAAGGEAAKATRNHLTVGSIPLGG